MTLVGLYAVFDGIAGIVGSYNLDPRARLLNSEDVVAFESPDFATVLAEEFATFTSDKYTAKIDAKTAKTFAKPESTLKRIRLQLIQLLTPFM